MSCSNNLLQGAINFGIATVIFKNGNLSFPPYPYTDCLCTNSTARMASCMLSGFDFISFFTA